MEIDKICKSKFTELPSLFFFSLGSYNAKYATSQCDFPFLAHFECIANHEKLHHTRVSRIFMLVRAIMNKSNDFFYALSLVLHLSLPLCPTLASSVLSSLVA